MMRVSVMGGAEFDVVSNEELGSALKSQGDSIIKRMRGDSKRIMRKTAISAGVMPAAGPLVLSLLVVPSDTQVSLSLVTVQGADDHTLLANAVPVVYFGGASGPNPNRGDLIAVGPQVPYVTSWGEKTLWGHDGDEVFVLVYGAAGGSNVVATLKYHEWLSGDAEPRMM